MRKWIACVVMSIAVFSVVAAADTNNTVRFGLLYSYPTGDYSANGVKVEADNAGGVQGSYEYMFQPWIGLNFNLAYVKYDVNLKGGGASTKLGSDSTYPLSLSILFHPLENKAANWYIGPGITYVKYDDLHIKSSLQSTVGASNLNIDSDLTWNIDTGIDIELGESAAWGLNFDLNYINTSADAGSGVDIDVNPYNVGVGMTYKW